MIVYEVYADRHPLAERHTRNFVNVRSQRSNGKHLLWMSISQFDPQPSSATTKYLRERVIDMDQMRAAVFDIQMLV